jgi:hypothetical protein
MNNKQCGCPVHHENPSKETNTKQLRHLRKQEVFGVGHNGLTTSCEHPGASLTVSMLEHSDMHTYSVRSCLLLAK